MARRASDGIGVGPGARRCCFFIAPSSFQSSPDPKAGCYLRRKNTPSDGMTGGPSGPPQAFPCNLLHNVRGNITKTAFSVKAKVGGSSDPVEMRGVLW